MNTVPHVIGLCFRSNAVKDVVHGALWMALLSAFACMEHAPTCSVSDFDCSLKVSSRCKEA